jgi:alanine-synthesizing transaminase
MNDSEFHRIRRLPPYVFAEVNRIKAAARAAGKDIIDLGMGNPDSPTPKHIVDKLVETVRDGKTHRYSTSRGIPGLRKAWAGYYDRRFGVRLDPETQVCVTLGSKEGLANLAQAITAPGDTILTPNPSYPIHPFGFIIAGASIRHVPFGPGIDLMRELARAAEHSVPAPTMVVLNFPSNPTALTCGLEFYKEAVAWARPRGSGCSRTSPTPRSISATGRRPRSSRHRVLSTSRSSSARSPRPTPCRAGGSVSPPATRGWSRP